MWNQSKLLTNKHLRSNTGTIFEPNSDILQPDPFAASFIMKGKAYCKSSFISYGHFAKVANILIKPAFGKLTNLENSEMNTYKVRPGFFNMNCKNKFAVTFNNEETHLKSWAKAIATGSVNNKTYGTVPDWTIAISRNHSSSLHNTILDIYNAYLLSRAFDLDPKTVNILFIDGLPEISSNSTWKALFRQVNSIKDIKKPVMYARMIWGMADKDSPLNDKHQSQSIPNLESFRTFFLKKHNISYRDKQDCKNLNLLYLNTNKRVSARSNQQRTQFIYEEKVYSFITNLFEDHTIRQYKMQGSLQVNLEAVSHTDILVGLHSEYLVNILFLPKKALVFELFQTSTRLSIDPQYQTFARWRNLSYKYWEAESMSKENMSDIDIVQREVIHTAAEILRQMCF